MHVDEREGGPVQDKKMSHDQDELNRQLMQWRRAHQDDDEALPKYLFEAMRHNLKQLLRDAASAHQSTLRT